MNTSDTFSLLLRALAEDVRDAIDNLCVDTGVCGSLFSGPIPMSLSSWAVGFKAILLEADSDGSHGVGLDRLDCALRCLRILEGYRKH